MKRRTLISSAESRPARAQHTSPCGDCPWRRNSLRGWLGSLTSHEWLRAAHGEARIDCHTLRGPQCAGAATYRSNVCKRPKDAGLLLLPPDRGNVFATPAEFAEHHAAEADQ